MLFQGYVFSTHIRLRRKYKPEREREREREREIASKRAKGEREVDSGSHAPL